MNKRTLRKLINFFLVRMYAGDEGGGDAGGTPSGGDTRSAGSESGGEGKRAPADENIYGAITKGEGDDDDKGGKTNQGNGEGSGTGSGEDANFAGGEGDDGAAGGEGTGGGDGGEGAGGGDGEGDGEDGGKQPAATILKLDPETLAALRGPQQQQAAGDEAPSPEQLKKMLNPVEVTPELVAAIRDEDPQKAAAALQAFANATVKNAYSITKLLLAKKEKEFQAMLGPIQEAHTAQQTAQVRTAFYGTYKHLEKYDKIVKAAAREVSPVNADGSEKSQAQIFKEVAASTIATLKSLGINVQSNPNANPGAGGGNANGGGVPRPNKFSSSGRSGGENKQQQKPNDDQADFYPRR